VVSKLKKGSEPHVGNPAIVMAGLTDKESFFEGNVGGAFYINLLLVPEAASEERYCYAVPKGRSNMGK